MTTKRVDAFPRTRRPLPWFLAGFVVVLFFVPVDATDVKLHMPVSSFFDRFVVLILVCAWMWFGGDQRALHRTRRSKLYMVSALVFLGIAVASILFDATRLINIGQFGLSQRVFAQLASFFIVGWFALTALRYEDLRGFCSFLIGMAVFLSVGMIVERKTGYNIFYNWSAIILKPLAVVAPSPTDIHPVIGSDGRVVVVGPTSHGLAASTMLMAVFPLALVRALDAKTRRLTLRYAVAALLMVVAATATDRKTALIVPIVLLLYVGFYRPRFLLRIAPVCLLLVPLAIHFAAPGALGTILNPGAAAHSDSTTHRIGDFSPVVPDINVHPILGRGYGATDPIGQPSMYRINDDQYVDMIQQVGILGLVAYLWMILAPIVVSRRAIRGRDGPGASLALATSAGCVAFLVVNALFDTMSFPQAPYVFFIMASLSTIASSGPEGNCDPSPGVFWRQRALQMAPGGGGGRGLSAGRSRPTPSLL
jgi:fumarate reductase subunit D